MVTTPEPPMPPTSNAQPLSSGRSVGSGNSCVRPAVRLV